MTSRLRAWLWPDKADRVSEAWLQQHAAAETKVGIDQACIEWPINARRNNVSWLQTQILRQKAS